MRFMALDVGDKHIGIAISDDHAMFARPLEVVSRGQGAASFHRIASLVTEHAVDAVIVGLPLLPNGSEGKQVVSTRAYVNGLNKHVSTPIEYWDERDTSSEAAAIMSRNGVSRRRRKGKLDAVAAAVILQHYLDARSEGVTE